MLREFLSDNWQNGVNSVRYQLLLYFLVCERFYR
jgi:hypothetical protein